MAEKSDGAKPEAEFADGAIIIRVPARILKVAAKYAWDQHFRSHRLYVSDESEFAKEVLSQLRREDEAGNNMIHRMLDSAMVEVAEDGGEGVGERA